MEIGRYVRCGCGRPPHHRHRRLTLSLQRLIYKTKSSVIEVHLSILWHMFQLSIFQVTSRFVILEPCGFPIVNARDFLDFST